MELRHFELIARFAGEYEAGKAALAAKTSMFAGEIPGSALT
jgi:hypothetical protein